MLFHRLEAISLPLLIKNQLLNCIFQSTGSRILTPMKSSPAFLIAHSLNYQTTIRFGFLHNTSIFYDAQMEWTYSTKKCVSLVWDMTPCCIATVKSRQLYNMSTLIAPKRRQKTGCFLLYVSIGTVTKKFMFVLISQATETLTRYIAYPMTTTIFLNHGRALTSGFVRNTLRWMHYSKPNNMRSSISYLVFSRAFVLEHSPTSNIQAGHWNQTTLSRWWFLIEGSSAGN